MVEQSDRHCHGRDFSYHLMNAKQIAYMHFILTLPHWCDCFHFPDEAQIHTASHNVSLIPKSSKSRVLTTAGPCAGRVH